MATAKHCTLCQRSVEPRRKIGVGTLLLALATMGFWLLAIPFYEKRCPICWGSKLGSAPTGEAPDTASESPLSKVPNYVWLLGFLALFGLIGTLMDRDDSSSSQRSAHRSSSSKPVNVATAKPRKTRSTWFQNGTLHRSSVAEWNKARSANRLATAADWAGSRPRIETKVKNSGSMDMLRPYAAQLVTCVNEAAAGQGYESMKVSELAAGCAVLMGW